MSKYPARAEVVYITEVSTDTINELARLVEHRVEKHQRRKDH